MKDGECEDGWIFEGKWGDFSVKLYAVLDTIVYYIFPMIALFYFYGKVIRCYRNALKSKESTTSAATQKVKKYKIHNHHLIYRIFLI